MNKAIALCALTLAVLAAMSGSAAVAGSGPGADKQDLLGPAGNFYCSTLLPQP